MCDDLSGNGVLEVSSSAGEDTGEGMNDTRIGRIGKFLVNAVGELLDDKFLASEDGES